MAEQMTIITGSSQTEPVDGAPKDNVKEAPAEQAQDNKDTAAEKLECHSSGSDSDAKSGSKSGSGSENDSGSGDDSSNVEKKEKKKVAKEKIKKKSSGKKKEASTAESEKPMEVKDGQEEKGIMEKIKEKLIGHREPTEGK